MRPRTGSFFRRVFLWILSLALLLSAGSSALFYYRQMGDLQDDLELRSRSLINGLAAQVAMGVYAQDPALLSVAAQRLGDEPDVLFVAIYDTKQRELAHSGTFVPSPQAALMDEILREGRPPQPIAIDHAYLDRYAPIQLGGRDPLDVAYTRFADEGGAPTTIGVARVGFNLQIRNARLRETLRFGVLLGVSMLLLGAAVAYFIAGAVSGPILALARGADEIRAGNLHPRIDVTGQDELAILGDSFLRMAERLRKTMMALSALNRDLEEEVARRTRQLQSAYEFTSLLNAPIDRRGTDPVEVRPLSTRLVDDVREE